MPHRIPVVSDQPLTARAFETLKVYKDAEWGDEIEFEYVDSNGYYDRVLVFGKLPEPHGFAGADELIYTYSIAQVLTKPNAVSVLNAAIKNMINGTKHTNKNLRLSRGVAGMKSYATREDGRYLFDYDKPVAIDIETDGILGVTHTVDEVRPFSAALYQEHWPGPITFVSALGTDDHCVAFDTTELQELAYYLTQFKYPVYHNGKFDTRVLNRVFSEACNESVRLPVWFDTMLAHHVLNHAAREHGLKMLAQRYFNAPDWEHDMKQALGGSKDYSAMSPAAVAVYNGWDVVWTMELFKFLKPQIDADPQAEMALFFEQQVADMLLDVEVNGIPIDEDYMRDYGTVLKDRQQIILDELKQITGADLNPNSPKQVKEWFAKMGIDLAKTDEGHLQMVVSVYDERDPEHQVAQRILDYREAAKRKGTYVDGWSRRAKNGRVHPTFLVHGTATGRLSSTNPNSQNIPRNKEVRKIVG